MDIARPLLQSRKDSRAQVDFVGGVNVFIDVTWIARHGVANCLYGWRRIHRAILDARVAKEPQTRRVQAEPAPVIHRMLGIDEERHNTVCEEQSGHAAVAHAAAVNAEAGFERWTERKRVMPDNQHDRNEGRFRSA